MPREYAYLIEITTELRRGEVDRLSWKTFNFENEIVDVINSFNDLN